MDITFNCDKCGQHIVIDEAGVGMKLPCPKCGNELTIPSNPGWLVQINEVIRAQVQKILAGRAMVADARLAVQDVLRETGYQPKAGTDGTVEDFRSEDRRNLVIETNVAIANGYRQMREANDPDILQEYPA
jgi:ribosomal protein S27E